MILGVALAMREQRSRTPSPNYWGIVLHDDTVVGCAFRTPPQKLVVSHMPLTAIEALVEDIGGVYSTLPGVNGPKKPAEHMARAWTERHGGSWTTRIRLQVHSLTRVESAPDAGDGSLRKALLGDLDLAREWVEAYVRDTEIVHPSTDVAAGMIGGGRLYLWVDGGAPRCMVAAGRYTKTGCAIHSVYTPPHFRRRGYATAAVAALSDALLKGGCKFCCLYTDAANPTSNSIYAKLGYRHLRDDAEIDFAPLESTRL